MRKIGQAAVVATVVAGGLLAATPASAATAPRKTCQVKQTYSAGHGRSAMTLVRSLCYDGHNVYTKWTWVR